MGWRDRLSRLYEQADIAVGGYLPGGLTPDEVATSKEPTLPPPQKDEPVTDIPIDTSTELFRDTGRRETRRDEPRIEIDTDVPDLPQVSEVSFQPLPIEETSAELLSRGKPDPISQKTIEVIKKVKEKVYDPITIKGISEREAESERRRIKEGVKVYTDERQLDPITAQRESLMFQQRGYTEEELKQMAFGGGIEEIARLQQIGLSNEATRLISEAETKILPEFQAQVDVISKDLQAGAITKSQAEKFYNTIEEAYKEEITAQVDPRIDTRVKEVQDYLNEIAHYQRTSRALQLAPIVFIESYALGTGIRGGLGLIRATSGAKAATVTSRALTIGFLGATAIKTPDIIKSYKDNPLAFAIETVPAVVGFTLGVNPNIVSDLKNLGNKFINFQKTLFNDKKAMARTTRTQQKLVQKKKVKKSKKKVQTSIKEIKEYIKKANNNEIADYIKKLNKDTTMSVLEKKRILSVIMEAKTGIKSLTDLGNVIDNRLLEAINKFRGPVTVTPITPGLGESPFARVEGISGRIQLTPTGKVGGLVGLGKIETLGMGISRFKEGILGDTKSNQIRKQIDKLTSKLFNIQRSGTILNTQQENKQEAAIKTQLSTLQRSLIQQLAIETSITRLATAQVPTQAIIQTPALTTAQIPFFATPTIQITPKFKRPKIRPRLSPPIGFLGFSIEDSSKKPKYERKREKLIKKSLAFMPQAKQRGSWKNLALNPMKTIAQARDRTSFAKDNTTSASSRILTRKSYRKLSKPKGKEIGYYNRTKSKYRTYRIKKGKRIPLKDYGLIEFSHKRIDTQGEKSGLKLARLIKQKGWMKKPVKKKQIKRKDTRRIKFWK